MKIFNKILLFGVILISSNYNTSIAGDNVGQLNYLIDLENNLAGNENTIEDNMTINYSNVIGKYDSDKYYIEDGKLKYGRYELVYKLNSIANTGGLNDSNGNSIPGGKFYKVSDNEKISEYYIHWSQGTYYINNRNDSLFSWKLSTEEPKEKIFRANYVLIICMDIKQKAEDFYQLSEDEMSILQGNSICLSKFDNSSQKWYLTDEYGDFLIKKGTENEKIELNKVKLTINPNVKVILSNSVGGGNNTSLIISKFGKLVNKGIIEVQSNTTINSPTVELSGTATNEWDKTISNLDDVSIDNTDGIMIFKSGSTINDIDQGANSIVKNGNIDISDLIDFDNVSNGSALTSKNSNPININSSFYNTRIILFPESFTSANNVLTYFSTDSNFTDTTNRLFQNIKFFSDIKDSKGNITEQRHSTVQTPNSAVTLLKDTASKTKYNTQKDVISLFSYNKDNVLKLFYTSENINTFAKNPPLVVESGESVSLYDLLNNPSNHDISVSNIENYALDLLQFIEDLEIDYSKLTEDGKENLDKLKIVFDPAKVDPNATIKLFPACEIDDSTDPEIEIYDNEITIGTNYSNFPIFMEFDSNIQKVNIKGDNDDEYSYKMKIRDDTLIETTGNINLILDNTGILNLCELFNNGTGTLSIFQKDTSTPLIIRLLASNFKILKNSKLNINAPISLQLVKEGCLISAKAYKEIKDLTNAYMKIKIQYNKEENAETKNILKNNLLHEYSNISNTSTGVLKLLESINSELTEIESNIIETDYYKYFNKIGNDGKLTSNDGIKTYNEISKTQNNLIKINNYKIQALEDYIRVLNNHNNILGDSSLDTIISEQSTTLGESKENQIKMLKNKYINISDTTEKTSISSEITKLG